MYITHPGLSVQVAKVIICTGCLVATSGESRNLSTQKAAQRDVFLYFLLMKFQSNCITVCWCVTLFSECII